MPEGREAVERAAVTELGNGHVKHGGAVVAGPWVFVTGVGLSTASSGDTAAKAGSDTHLRWGREQGEREADVIYDRLEAVLADVDSSLSGVVRLDQYYRNPRVVDPYHVVRRRRFDGRIPPSTSVLQAGFLHRNATIDVSAIAVKNRLRDDVELTYAPELYVPSSSGYCTASRVGDWVFGAGAMASGESGIAPAARLQGGMIWGGTEAALETDYILAQRIAPALETAGSSLDDVVKAQVYVRDIDDIPAFNRVWREFYDAETPATTVLPSSGFGIAEGRIEINVIATTKDSQLPRETVRSEDFASYEGHSAGVRVGDMLFISGLLAVDSKGIVESAVEDETTPYFASSIEAQMEHILRTAEGICTAAGTSLRNTVRAQQFHTDLHDFYPAYRVWQRRLPDTPIPFSGMQVPEPMPVAGCTVALDLWVHVPGNGVDD
ncbi:MAG: RidA family protein [Solirubrobacterales bacterium]